MRVFLFLFLIIASSGIFAQDGISPMTANPDLFGKLRPELKKLPNSFDSTIFYITDTISIPFFDDFSRDNFQNYTAEIGDAGMVEKVSYRMLDENTMVPLPVGTQFTSNKTYRLEYDQSLDTSYIHYFDSISFYYDPLTKYEPNYTLTYGYPPYLVFDSVGISLDTIYLMSDIDFIQDSARIFIKILNDLNKLWLNKQAYHNYRFAQNPWSIGVVTFDGLDEWGYPYNFNSVANSYNDTLLAKPIDLSSKSAGDSVYFSFLYQKEGFGDAPEADKDSLLLEFYSPVTEVWNTVWRTNGGETADFKVAHLRVDNPAYFHKGFQFRFINFGSPAGALDHFHIDYVHLRASSGHQDTLFKDFAFVYPINSLLKDYTAVPWKHFRANPTDKMGDSVLVTVRNGSELVENNQNGRVNIFYDGNLEGSFTLNASRLSGGDINYAPRTTYTSFHDFSNDYVFDTSINNDTLAHFDFFGTATAQFPNNPINDTTFGTQIFENYYAYDDGTAEKAYGVTGIQGLLAVQFNAYQPDSLVGVQIHFVPSVVDVSNNLFLLTVWNDNNGVPGQKIYEDEIFYPRQPVYKSGRNKFANFIFKDTMRVPVGETFYVGMRQIEEERLNIGFDANIDNSDKIFWSVDNGHHWNNGSYPGSVMIRPIITSKMDYQLGIKEQISSASNYDFVIYPNPARSSFQMKGNNINSGTKFELLDINGRLLQTIYGATQTNISDLQEGVYFVRRIEQKQVVNVQKLVVQ